jgi:methionine-rich copper-binding protein CopC
VNSIDPAKGAVDVLNNQSVNVTFTEPVKLGNGDIVLETSNGTVVNVSNSISGDVLTITPTNLLTNDTKYNVIIHTGSVTDLEGDPVALWSSSFSVGPAPTITSIDPANEATNVSTSKIITVSFSEPIEVGNSDIQFTNSSGSAIPFTKTISGNVLIIIPTNPLAESTKYTLTLHTGSVTDLTGNPLKLTSTTFTTTKT